jgi:hypothetical protein
MELFRLPGPMMYVDLDSVIVGDLSDLLAYPGRCAILRDFNLREHREVKGVPAIGSAVILWRDDAMRPVWDAFMADPEGIIRRHPKRADHFLVRHLPADVEYVQDVFPGQVACAKDGFRGMRKAPPQGARIITTWKSPRIHELSPAHWLRRAWEAA